ncbi:MAG: hypothetical protein ABIA04_06045 [Pseudomonadota bacterium]
MKISLRLLILLLIIIFGLSNLMGCFGDNVESQDQTQVEDDDDDNDSDDDDDVDENAPEDDGDAENDADDDTIDYALSACLSTWDSYGETVYDMITYEVVVSNGYSDGATATKLKWKIINDYDMYVIKVHRYTFAQEVPTREYQYVLIDINNSSWTETQNWVTDENIEAPEDEDDEVEFNFSSSGNGASYKCKKSGSYVNCYIDSKVFDSADDEWNDTSGYYSNTYVDNEFTLEVSAVVDFHSYDDDITITDFSDPLNIDAIDELDDC